MTLKGLVFGDSHAGMLVEALQLPHSGPDGPVALDFFVKPGGGPRGFDINGSQIVPTDPALTAFLAKIKAPARPDLSNYDFVVIAGCGVSIFSTVQTASKVAVVGSGKASRLALQGKTDGLAPLKHPLISAQGFRQVVRDRLRDCLAFTLLDTLSTHSDLSIFLVPQPRPRILLRDIPKRGKGFADTTKFADGALVSGVFDDVIRSVCREIAPCSFLAQSAETIEDHIFTTEKYCQGAFRLSNPGMRQARRDVIHANADYGAVILRQIQSVLKDDGGR